MGLKEKEGLWNIGGIDFDLLNQAMTHPSYDKEGKFNNQRLEFLGDSLLGMILAEYLYDAYKGLPEGELTKLRSALVRESTLAKISKGLGIGEVIRLGRGEEKDGGRERISILADALESLIAAIYLSFGIGKTREFVLYHFAGLEKNMDLTILGDYKSTLQEKVQSISDVNIMYGIISDEGPAHKKTFIAGVYYKDKLISKGEGRSKKEAEKSAAKIAYDTFDQWKDVLDARK